MTFHYLQKFIFLFVLLCLFSLGCNSKKQPEHETAEFSAASYGLPQKADVVLVHKGFIIGYSDKYRQALWVSYVLTAADLQQAQIRRSNRFQADPLIPNHPVFPLDYRKTGYDKGHLAPAADMAFSIDAMTHSFYMSNISPQLPGFNRGIWKRLEVFVREAALKESIVLVVTGPVFASENQTISMRDTNIPVPAAFYKILFDVTPPEKMICFIIPNAASKKPLHSFVVTIDGIETLTGLQFFPALSVDRRKAIQTNMTISNWNASR